jgi:hypothetical protein
VVGGETIIDGQYTVTLAATTLGIMKADDGVPTLEPNIKAQPIAGTDAYGDTTIDAVWRGADWYCSMICMEYRAGVLTALWPFSATMGRLGVIGRLFYDMSSALVLTAVAGTPAATSPASLTASKAIIAPGFSNRLTFGPLVRTVPLRFLLLPYIVSSTNVQPFVLT